MIFTRQQRLVHLILVGLAGFGMALLVAATRLGPGVGGDATIYISSAQNLLAGHGLGLVGPRGEFRLLPYFPPGFSLSLSAIGLFFADLVSAARWLNILCFGGIVWLAGTLTWKATHSVLYSALAGVIFCVSPVLIPISAWAMSEPLSLFLGMAGLAFLLDALVESTSTPAVRVWPLAASALLCGLSFLTRYNALAFLLAGGIYILIFERAGWWRRTVTSLVYMVVAVLPVVFWSVYDILQTSTVSSRSLIPARAYIERLVSLWTDMQGVLLSWMIPDSWIYHSPYPGIVNRILPYVLIFVLLAWIVLIFVWTRRYPSSRASSEWLHLFCLLSILGLLFMGFTITIKMTTYPPITINPRMLAILYVTVMLIGILLAYQTQKIWNQMMWLKLVLPAGLVFLCLAFAWNSVHIVVQTARSGLGYYALEWRNSQTLQAVRDLPKDKIIITNQDMAVLALTGRSSYPLKEIYAQVPKTQFSRFGDGDLTNDEPQRLFRDEGAVLVLFDTIDDQFSGLYGDRTNARIQKLVQGLSRAYRGEDGGIFYYSKP